MRDRATVPRQSWIAAVAALVAPPLCVRCGHHAGRGEPLCGPCRRGLRWFDRETARVAAVELWAPVAYEGPAQALVAGVKFRGALALADTMAAQIAAGAPPEMLEDSTLVPVPLHPARRRRRGFNQAERLAAALARRTDLPVLDCLERTGPASTQVGRGRAQRTTAITGSIALRAGARAPRAPVIVDDVVTTGATIAACGRVLMRAGAARVRAVAYARTPAR